MHGGSTFRNRLDPHSPCIPPLATLLFICLLLIFSPGRTHILPYGSDMDTAFVSQLQAVQAGAHLGYSLRIRLQDEVRGDESVHISDERTADKGQARLMVAVSGEAGMSESREAESEPSDVGASGTRLLRASQPFFSSSNHAADYSRRYPCRPS